MTKDLTHGKPGRVLFCFALPVIGGNLFQLFYTLADSVIVGRMMGADALAAVGSTGALVNLLINLFIGVSVGCNVLVARYYGARNEKAVSETVHCAMGASLLIGLAALAVLFACSYVLSGAVTRIRRRMCSPWPPCI